MLYGDIINRDMKAGKQKSIHFMNVVIFILLVHYCTPVTYILISDNQFFI